VVIVVPIYTEGNIDDAADRFTVSLLEGSNKVTVAGSVPLLYSIGVCRCSMLDVKSEQYVAQPSPEEIPLFVFMPLISICSSIDVIVGFQRAETITASSG